MRLQDVLKERETEITLLEESLKAAESRANGYSPPAPTKINGLTIPPHLLRTESGESEEFMTAVGDHPDYDNTNGRTTPISSSPIPPVNLSPKTMNQFKAIRRSLDLSGLIKLDGEDSAQPLEQDNSLERLNELMRYDIPPVAQIRWLIYLAQVDGPEGVYP